MILYLEGVKVDKRSLTSLGNWVFRDKTEMYLFMYLQQYQSGETIVVKY